MKVKKNSDREHFPLVSTSFEGYVWQQIKTSWESTWSIWLDHWECWVAETAFILEERCGGLCEKTLTVWSQYSELKALDGFNAYKLGTAAPQPTEVIQNPELPFICTHIWAGCRKWAQPLHLKFKNQVCQTQLYPLTFVEGFGAGGSFGSSK